MKKVLFRMKLRKGYDIAEKKAWVMIPENVDDEICGWVDAGYDIELSVRITKETEVEDDDF